MEQSFAAVCIFYCPENQSLWLQLVNEPFQMGRLKIFQKIQYKGTLFPKGYVFSLFPNNNKKIYLITIEAWKCNFRPFRKL